MENATKLKLEINYFVFRMHRDGVELVAECEEREPAEDAFSRAARRLDFGVHLVLVDADDRILRVAG